jgi:hypothetical protein
MSDDSDTNDSDTNDSDTSADWEDWELYLEVPDVSHWVHLNKEICTRLKVENEFVVQLQNDPILRQVFEHVNIEKNEVPQGNGVVVQQ